MMIDVSSLLGVDLSVAKEIIENLINTGALPPQLEFVRGLLETLINFGLIDTAIAL
ncbi:MULTISPECIES: hypothetical protein [Paenibacillus]|uniref:Uncharacterized protein n=1 Tax=Paenibacillus arenosi TaxID=2774142 RepID=A0ABR9ASW9_9BACL|nr:MULTISPECIES: hypothetical protein [Paenibacillus]MBD8497208.1 hypothetical protein [Paenibacillus arenosi]